MIRSAAVLALAAALMPATARGATPEQAATTPTTPAGTRWTVARVRFAGGAEWDTNARRAVQGADVQGGRVPFPEASRPQDVVADGVGRVVLDASAALRFNAHHGLRGFYVLGGKRFFAEQTEDILAQELGLRSENQWTSRFGTSVDGSYKGSRMRSGARDYDVATTGFGMTFRLADWLQADLQTRLTRFGFAIEPRFDYWGPRGTVGLRARPARRFILSMRGGATGRWYDGRALVEGVFVGQGGTTTNPSSILTFCENPAAERAAGYACTPAGARRDVEWTGSLSFSYRGSFLVSGQYLMRLQRSNSDFENIDRHRVEVAATFGLPGRLTLNVLGTLQVNDGVSITDQKFLADDDENQNSLIVGLQRPIGGDVYAEGRYALFSNQFSTADASFIRHTVYFGVGVRADLLDASR